MSGSVNKVIPEPSRLYLDGLSITQVSKVTGIAVSTLRYRFKAESILRTRATGIRMAAQDGRLGSGFRGKRRKFTPEHCAAISSAAIVRAEKTAAGVSEKPNGYVEYTRGEHKGRSVHVVAMEERIGRRLLPDECVHHIDGNPINNNINNLALVTRSGHQRLHRREQRIRKGTE